VSGGREAVHARRARLLERAASERDDLARQLGAWRMPLGVVDQGLAIVRVLKRSAPVIGIGMGVATAALAFVRPASIRGWLDGGRAVWRMLTDRSRGPARPSEPGETPAAEGEAK